MNNDLHRRQQGKGTTASDHDLSITGNWGRDLHFKTQNVAVFFENHLAFGKNLPLNPGFRVESGASKMTGNISYYDTNKFPKTIEHKFPLFGISGEYKLTEKQKNIQVFLKHIVQLYLRISYLVRLSKNHLII